MKFYYQVEGHLKNNIGDVLQGLVAKAFLPKDAKVADREALSEMDRSEPSLLVANGWYNHGYDHFPPPANVTPIYVSVHIAQSAFLVVPRVREHFRQHAPIGCRDNKTLQLFLGWGIPAYYSSCLTTTARTTVSVTDPKVDEILLVDNVDHPVPDEVQAKLEQLLGGKLTRVSHDPPDASLDFLDYAKASEAHMQSLLDRYAKAKLVVTTKIHCALPCLGMGANVMVVHPNPADPRVDTVREFIDIYSYKDVLAATTLPVPTVRKEQLAARKAFLADLISKAVTSGTNPIQKDPKYSSLRLKAKVSAAVLHAGLKVIYKVGFKKAAVQRVYGADF